MARLGTFAGNVKPNGFLDTAIAGAVFECCNLKGAGSLRALEVKYSGQLWPNGEFGASRVREALFPSLCESHAETAETQFNRLGIKAHGVMAVLKFRNKLEAVLHPGSSIRSKSRNRAKRGSKGITSHGRKMVRNAGFILEREYDRALLSFGTVTVPRVSAVEALQIARNWSEITRRFLDHLTQGLQRRKLPTQRICVTEVQEQRSASAGYPVLHLHFCFVGRMKRGSAWQVNHEMVRNWWKLAIAPYVAPDTDFTATENVVRVRKSVAGYLGKYMSKGSKTIAAIAAAGQLEYLPSAWFNCSKTLRRMINAERHIGLNVGEWLRWVVESNIDGIVLYSRPVMVDRADGSQIQVGWFGRISQQGVAMWKAWVKIGSTPDLAA